MTSTSAEEAFGMAFLDAFEAGQLGLVRATGKGIKPGYVDVIIALLAAGACITPWSLNALHGEDLKQDPAVIRLYFDHGLDPNATQTGGEPILGLEPNLLFETVGYRQKYGDLMTKYLLDKGVHPNRATSEEFGNPLHLAALASKPHIVRMLLDAGADPTTPSSSWRFLGQTPEQIVLETLSDPEDATNEEKAVLRLLRLGQAEESEANEV
ncbi:hypothetical protein DL98DRAFT_598461 [Cadophora sp. DSE1049]|nr:hypothetical protein DL98DRAFT_598461 [Cadophora sp. DSE1049]